MTDNHNDGTKIPPDQNLVENETSSRWAEPILLKSFCALVLIVVARITWGSIATGVSPDERLIEMAQWTIGTVLTVAIGLVGFNWFTSSRNQIREDRMIETRFRVQDKSIYDSLEAAMNRLAVAEDTVTSQSDEISLLIPKVSSYEGRISEFEVKIQEISDSFERQIAVRDLNTSYICERRAQWAKERGDVIGALLEVCNGIIALQRTGSAVMNSFLDGVEDILGSFPENLPLSETDKYPYLGRHSVDNIRTALSILKSQWPNHRSTNWLQKIVRDWSI